MSFLFTHQVSLNISVPASPARSITRLAFLSALVSTANYSMLHSISKALFQAHALQTVACR